MAVLILLLALSPAAAQADALTRDELKIKAGLLYNYLKYTTWPPRETEAAYLNVCLYGGDPFRGQLQSLDGRTAQQYTIRLLHAKTLNDIKACDALFIDAAAEKNLPDIFAVTHGQGVLTMSDIENFALRGGMVGFSMQGKHIHVVVNKSVAEKDGIHIQPSMLKMGEVVNQ
ncbi:MAG: YfiR family protein [Micavibrio sp.]|nr:YfiR family protein [Micavibrio sp.]